MLLGQAFETYQVRLIQHAHRHADLRVYTFAAGQCRGNGLPGSQEWAEAQSTATTQESDSDSDNEAALHNSPDEHAIARQEAFTEAQAALSVAPELAAAGMPRLHPATLLTARQVRPSLIPMHQRINTQHALQHDPILQHILAQHLP